MLANLREALRQLRKAPGVTTTAVITLRTGNRSHNRHLYPCAPSDAEIAAGHETGRALEDRR